MKTRATLLVVDDDPDVLQAARLLLSQHFERVLTIESPEDIEALMAKERIDVFLIDMNFALGRNSGAEGLHWQDRILTRDPDAVVVLMTAFGDLNTAVRAMREGAADFVLKPWQNDKLVATLSVAARLRRTSAQLSALSTPPAVGGMVAESPAMQEVLKVVARVAPTDVNVLIRGENGTGKELIARALHEQSARQQRPFVTVDLGAVSASLFESELFGHTRGAFTDAVDDRAGRFQAADGGTLFLDEIGNLPAALQTRLLRAVETREVTPLGSDKPVPVDVRLLSATHRPLEQLVESGEFREDLFYRLNTVEILLPPLRERPQDLEPLARHFLAMFARKYGLAQPSMSSDVLDSLRAHRWPGNVRELSHAIERAIILSDGGALDAAAFQLDRPDTTAAPPESLNLEENERRMVATAVEQCGGNISQAAALLGITRAALYRRIEKFGL